MIASRRQLLLIAGVILLVALNVWRWWPTKPKAGVKGTSDVVSTGFRVQDFEVRARVAADTESGRRDPFRKVVKFVPKPTPKGPPPPPVKTPEELAVEAAQAELGQIRCMGISLRGGVIQAFMVIGAESQVVGMGEKVGSRFIVERITTEAVTVRDPETKVGGEIGVSGK